VYVRRGISINPRMHPVGLEATFSILALRCAGVGSVSKIEIYSKSQSDRIVPAWHRNCQYSYQNLTKKTVAFSAEIGHFDRLALWQAA
jgi:hypothetical protein